MWLLAVLVIAGLVISLAIFGLTLLIGFAGGAVPFMVLGASERQVKHTEDSIDWGERPPAFGTHDWYLKLRKIELNPNSSRDISSSEPHTTSKPS